MQLAMIRAHICKQIAEHSSYTKTQTCFTVGLLSTLEDLPGLPMTEILKMLPLSHDSRVAILNHEGEAGKILKCALAYEQADWQQAKYKQLSATQLRDSFFNALIFSDNNKILMD